ncbi:MAG: DUF1566 domain-containing protein [Pirellulaceae bacterium]|jgi:hypothetical protein|nr:DUF1566 domain-containing protein [Pirellulaceae bacterium]HJN10595.1 DUF1566 domain-containing protein [Pirellulaceae bacterium]
MGLRAGFITGLAIAGFGAVCQAQTAPVQRANALSYCVVDTGQSHCFSDRGQLLKAPQPGEPFFGQDAFYQGPNPNYRDNGNGTVSDLNTGLMWQKTSELNRKLTFPEALARARRSRSSGYGDWRLPTIKELYSLIDFNGNARARPPVPYIDTHFFDFSYGNESMGERLIDAQYWSSTEYVGLTMRGNATVFGVNFADGRIKGYPRDTGQRGERATHFVRLVRGNPSYGNNRFVDHGDGTISDLATGLMWSQADSDKVLNWQQALAWCEELPLAGHDDWRLPNAKELQSIVDYKRAPDSRDLARRGPAIDPVFKMTSGEGWMWSSTTHLEGPGSQGGAAVYLAFGRATGFMPTRRGRRHAMNVHGAGAQRSDPKSGNPNDRRWASGLGPQGDEIRIYNYARAVRNIDQESVQRVQPNLVPLPVSALRPRRLPR